MDAEIVIVVSLRTQRAVGDGAKEMSAPARGAGFAVGV
jgi:hypothetical protein